MAGGFDLFNTDTGAGAGFDDSRVLLPAEKYGAFAQSLLVFTPGGSGYDAFADAQGGEVEESGFFEQAFRPEIEQRGGLGDGLAVASLVSSSAPRGRLEVLGHGGHVELAGSLDEVGFVALHNRFVAPRAPLETSPYAPCPKILALEPEAAPGLTSIYAPMSVPHFRTSADAKAHRRRARLAPKSQATDVARVKTFGREYWVRRIYNAIIDTNQITDGPQSIHRIRFTQKLDGHPTFSALDLEATAHHIFDEAIAVHERGWNRPTTYHKKVVRGKLVDLSEASLEMRLSRICLCLQQKKSSVDDAIRGGVTLALLCDNPEARSFTKASNDVGNKKRGERLRATKTKRKTKTKKALQALELEAEVEEQEIQEDEEVKEEFEVREEK